MNKRSRLIRAQAMITNVARDTRGEAQEALWKIVAALNALLTDTKFVGDLPPVER